MKNEMSRKVTLQVFGTNAPAETRQPAEYISDVQSVEMVLDIDGNNGWQQWMAAILKNTAGTHYLAPTWLHNITGDPLAKLREGDIIRVGSARASRWSPDVRVLEKLRVRKFRNDTGERVSIGNQLDSGSTYTKPEEITVLRIDTALDVTSVTRPYINQTSGVGDEIALDKRHLVLAYNNRDRPHVYPLYRVARRPEPTRSWISIELGPHVRSVDAVRLKAYAVEQPVAPSHLREEPFAQHELQDPSCIVLSVKGATGPVRNDDMPHVNDAFAVLHAGTHAVDGARRHYERAANGALASMEVSAAVGIGGRLELGLVDLAGQAVHGAAVQLWLEVDTTHT